MTYAMSTTLAVNAAVAPAHVELPASGIKKTILYERQLTRLTVEECIQGKKINTNRSCEHGYREAQ